MSAASSRFPVFKTPADMLADIEAATKGPKLVRNYCGEIEDMSEEAIVVVTELFPADALRFYTRFNLNTLDLADAGDAALHAKFYNPARGGGQGDYREGIAEKIANVVDCLKKFPKSKRAVLTIPNNPKPSHTTDEDAKCLRELHFYLEPVDAAATTAGSGAAAAADAAAPALRLSCSGFMRAQAATIFPKNIHFIGTVMNTIAKELGVPVGHYVHFVTNMVDGRES